MRGHCERLRKPDPVLYPPPVRSLALPQDLEVGIRVTFGRQILSTCEVQARKVSLEMNLTVLSSEGPQAGRRAHEGLRVGPRLEGRSLEPDRLGLLFLLGHCVTLTSSFHSPSLSFLFYKVRRMMGAVWCQVVVKTRGHNDAKV